MPRAPAVGRGLARAGLARAAAPGPARPAMSAGGGRLMVGDATIAAYCAQLQVDELIALATAEPRAMAAALEALDPPSLLWHCRGSVLPWRAP